MFKSVSIIIPVYNEATFIEKFLVCITEQSYPQQFIETIIVDGGSKDGTIDIINEFIENHPFDLKLFHNENKLQCYALNIGLKESRGEIIIRLDAHSIYEKDYIKKIVKHLENEEIINIGGVARAKGYDYMSRIIAVAVSSPIGIGDAKFRYTNEFIEAETVFPGAWRKKDLVKIKGWNEDWKVNEDTELNMRLKKEMKGRIVIDPDIKLFYYPRNSFLSLCKQYFKFGCWRIKTINVHPEALRNSHMMVIFTIALLLSFSLVFLIGFNKINTAILYFIVISGMVYLTTVIYCSVGLGMKELHSVHSTFLLSLCIVVMHLSWAAGAFWGMLKFGIPLKAINKKLCHHSWT